MVFTDLQREAKQRELASLEATLKGGFLRFLGLYLLVGLGAGLMFSRQTQWHFLLPITLGCVVTAAVIGRVLWQHQFRKKKHVELELAVNHLVPAPKIPAGTRMLVWLSVFVVFTVGILVLGPQIQEYNAQQRAKHYAQPAAVATDSPSISRNGQITHKLSVSPAYVGDGEITGPLWQPAQTKLVMAESFDILYPSLKPWGEPPAELQLERDALVRMSMTDRRNPREMDRHLIRVRLVQFAPQTREALIADMTAQAYQTPTAPTQRIEGQTEILESKIGVPFELKGMLRQAQIISYVPAPAPETVEINSCIEGRCVYYGKTSEADLHLQIIYYESLHAELPQIIAGVRSIIQM